MSVIVHLRVASDSFSLGELLRIDADMRIQLERIVPTSGDIVPFFWASGGDFEEFERALRREEMVTRLEAIDRIERDGDVDKALYNVDWRPMDEYFMHRIIDSHATVLDGHGNYREWRFQIRFPGQEVVSEFQRESNDRGIEFEVERLYTLEEWEGNDGFGLTDKQRRALTAAVESGYFDIPRTTSLDELSEQFGVSRQALSERLRRGEAQLVANTLLEEESP